MDRITPEQRSRLMSSVRTTGTKPEMLLRKRLWKKGYRYRVKNKLACKPDLVFVKHRVVVFVDGCFWHNCTLHGSIPRTNIKFWKKKIEDNVCRDKRCNEALKKSGWVVLRFWEHEIFEDVERVIARIEEELK